jgi:hypothetical protein
LNSLSHVWTVFLSLTFLPCRIILLLFTDLKAKEEEDERKRQLLADAKAASAIATAADATMDDAQFARVLQENKEKQDITAANEAALTALGGGSKKAGGMFGSFKKRKTDKPAETKSTPMQVDESTAGGSANTTVGAGATAAGATGASSASSTPTAAATASSGNAIASSSAAAAATTTESSSISASTSNDDQKSSSISTTKTPSNVAEELQSSYQDRTLNVADMTFCMENMQSTSKSTLLYLAFSYDNPPSNMSPRAKR